VRFRAIRSTSPGLPGLPGFPRPPWPSLVRPGEPANARPQHPGPDPCTTPELGSRHSQHRNSHPRTRGPRPASQHCFIDFPFDELATIWETSELRTLQSVASIVSVSWSLAAASKANQRLASASASAPAPRSVRVPKPIRKHILFFLASTVAPAATPHGCGLSTRIPRHARLTHTRPGPRPPTSILTIYDFQKVPFKSSNPVPLSLAPPDPYHAFNAPLPWHLATTLRSVPRYYILATSTFFDSSTYLFFSATIRKSLLRLRLLGLLAHERISPPTSSILVIYSA
jgi:hypothetical protein